jgi:hypothetical protein
MRGMRSRPSSATAVKMDDGSSPDCTPAPAVIRAHAHKRTQTPIDGARTSVGAQSGAGVKDPEVMRKKREKLPAPRERGDVK